VLNSSTCYGRMKVMMVVMVMMMVVREGRARVVDV
jgi:hypothetical protein